MNSDRMTIGKTHPTLPMVDPELGIETKSTLIEPLIDFQTEVFKQKRFIGR